MTTVNDLVEVWVTSRDPKERSGVTQALIYSSVDFQRSFNTALFKRDPDVEPPLTGLV